MSTTVSQLVMYVHGVTLLSYAANVIQYYTLDYNVKSNRSSQVVDQLPVHGSGVVSGV